MPYQTKLFETCIAYSKAIIIKVITISEYGNPNVTQRLSIITPPHGIPYEYNY